MRRALAKVLSTTWCSVSLVELVKAAPREVAFVAIAASVPVVRWRRWEGCCPLPVALSQRRAPQRHPGYALTALPSL